MNNLLRLLKQLIWKHKRKNHTGDTDDPFYPEYWRGDVPPPPSNPGYFESTR